jgi:hypothetical protein
MRNFGTSYWSNKLGEHIYITVDGDLTHNSAFRTQPASEGRWTFRNLIPKQKKLALIDNKSFIIDSSPSTIFLCKT